MRRARLINAVAMGLIAWGLVRFLPDAVECTGVWFLWR